MFWIKKNMHMLLSILLLIFTITIFGPIELYYTNHEEFWFTYRDTFLISGLLALVCISLLLAVGLLLKGKMRDLYSSLVFAAGAALYIQGNFANMNYGSLNGEAVDWGAYPVYAALDTLGWVAVIATGIFLCVRKKELFYHIQKYGSLFFIAVQAVTLVILFFTAGNMDLKKSEYYLSNEGLYEVSSKENILIFVLDAFDDVYFQELLKEEPEKYKEVFSGFTHFNNASAGGAATKIGMPAIITGEHYPGKVSYPEYIAQAFDNDGLYSALQKNNYDVRLYTKPSFVPDASGGLVNNQVSEGFTVSSYTGLSKTYFSLVLYRYMPHILKKFFWLYTGDFDYYKSGNSKESYAIDDAVYLAKLLDEGLEVTKEKNIFRLVHLNGAHPPYALNEYAQEVGEDNTSKERQRQGALYIIENYLNILKKLGLYENSTIIVMADHGQKNLLEHGILLVKEKNGAESFAESGSPVSYYDLHPTIFRDLGVEKGQTFFEVQDEKRERYFYFNDTQAGRMQVVEYLIDADLNQKVACHKTGVIFAPTATDIKYKYGTTLTFGADNTATDYIVSGISSTDMDIYSWTDGKECVFEFHLEEMPKENLLAVLDILTVYDGNGTQRMKIYANETECYEETLSKGCKLEFEIPKKVILEDQILKLRIELPDAVSPLALFGEGNDSRTLGIALRGLQIKEKVQLKEDKEKQEKQLKEWKKLNAMSEYRFGTDGNADDYLIGGWHQPEEGHIWASESADLLLRTDEICDYSLIVSYSAFEASGKTEVYVNDTLLSALGKNESNAVITVPKELLKKDGVQVITFKTPEACSPMQVETGDDRRVLGVCLFSMEIKPAEIGN